MPMFLTEILEVSDKSYYADSLEQLTGKSRVYWARLPLPMLRQILRKETEAKRGDRYGYKRSPDLSVLRSYRRGDLCSVESEA